MEHEHGFWVSQSIRISLSHTRVDAVASKGRLVGEGKQTPMP